MLSLCLNYHLTVQLLTGGAKNLSNQYCTFCKEPGHDAKACPRPYILDWVPLFTVAPVLKKLALPTFLVCFSNLLIFHLGTFSLASLPIPSQLLSVHLGSHTSPFHRCQALDAGTGQP